MCDPKPFYELIVKEKIKFLAERGMLRVNHLTVDRLMDVKTIPKLWGVGVKKLSFSKWSHHLVWHNMGTMIYDKKNNKQCAWRKKHGKWWS